MTGRSFPTDFVWGAATAAYQIEGAVSEHGRGESIWDRFVHTPATIVDGSTGDVACDHYHRWQEDIRLMVDLGLAAYRFSIAWPRIVPVGSGRVELRGLDFYDRLVDGLLTAGITPWITLYHWDLPQPLEDAGGWPNRDTADRFVDYVDVVCRRLGDRVHHWITFNEPIYSATLGYQTGEHAPGRTNWPDALQAAHTQLLAHGRAVPVIRQHSPGAHVGITLNLAQSYPASETPEDRAAAYRVDGFHNRWFLDPIYGRGYPSDMVRQYGAASPVTTPDDFVTIAAPIDFLGVNYYSPYFIKADPVEPILQMERVYPPGLEFTHMQLAEYPKGLTDLLLDVAGRYPVGAIYVTENGASYDDSPPIGGRVSDPRRIRYLDQHLAATLDAIERGAPVRGYFAWSLLDNFEWALGYTQRFGLIYTDYRSLERTIKDSGYWYQQVIQRNGL